MKRSLLFLAVLALGAARAQSPAGPAGSEPTRAEPAAQTAAPPASPAKNWVLPLFTDKEGFRTMTLRGSEARAVGANRIDVVDLNIMVFSGDATARVDSVLLSPQASFFPKEDRATGEKSVRLVRDDVEVTGEGWSYDHATKKVSLAQNARVVFRAQLNDILK